MKMNSPFESIIAFYRKYGAKSTFSSISDITFDIKFTKELANEIAALNSIIYKACQQNIIENIYIDGKSYGVHDNNWLEVNVNKNCKFSFDSVSVKGTGYIYYALDEFLKLNKTKKPSVFFIAEIDYASFDKNKNAYIETYESTIELINTLIDKDNGICDFSTFEDSNNIYRVVLLGETKLEFETTYQKNDLKNDSRKIKDFIKDIKIDSDSVITHKKEKNQILKKSISNLIKHINKDSEKFSYILSHIEELKREYNNGLDLYLNEFTFSKFISDLSEKKISYIEKINKIISDIGLKLLFIPLIGVATKISTTGSDDSLALTLYAALMMLLIVYTTDSLKQISQEMQNAFHHRKYKKSILTSGSIEQELRDACSQLNIRIWCINTVLFCLYIGLLLFGIHNVNEGDILGFYENVNFYQSIQFDPLVNLLIMCFLIGTMYLIITRVLYGIYKVILWIFTAR